MKIRENQFLYTGTFFDNNEMLSWVKTFTGRIMDITMWSATYWMKPGKAP